MRTLLHLAALIGGVALVYRGLAEGLPALPLSRYAWGTVCAFGFGALLALVGLRYVWLRLTGDDAPIGGSTAVLMVALSIAVTVGAVAWRGRASSRECVAMLEHVQALVVARDPSLETRARFEEARPKILRRCARLTSAQRSCSMLASSVEALQRCP